MQGTCPWPKGRSADKGFTFGNKEPLERSWLFLADSQRPRSWDRADRVGWGLRHH
jgi:hypothetical protein